GAAGRSEWDCSVHIGLQEEGDEAAEKAVEEARLGERETEPLVTLDLCAQLGLAGLGLDRGVEYRSDARPGPSGTATGSDAQRDRATGILALLDDRFDDTQQRVNRTQEV